MTGEPHGETIDEPVPSRVRRWITALDPRQWPSRPRVLLLRVAAGVNPALACLAVVSVALGGVLPTAFMLASGRLAGAVPAVMKEGFASAAGSDLTRALVLVAATYALQLMLMPLLNLGTQALVRRVDRSLTERVMLAILGPAGIAHLEDPAMQDDVAKATGIVTGTTPGAALAAFVQLWSMRMAGVGAFVVVVGFRWWIAVMLLASLLLEHRYWVGRYDEVTQAFFDTGQIHRRSSWYRDAALLPGPAKEVRAFGLEKWFRERQQTAWGEAMVPVWGQMWGRPLRLAWNGAWPVIPHALAFAVLGRAAIRGEVGVESVVVFAQAIHNIQTIGASGDANKTVATGVASLPIALELEARLNDPALTLPGARPAAGLPRELIRFEKVGFRYRGRDDDVYDELDLEIPAGQSLAIVGANGAGKTTFVKLLARLYEPTSGRITVDGVNVNEIDPRDWQRRIAAIFQDFHRYDLPARDNVAFGAPGLADDDEALERAAAKAGADTVVRELEDGWDTPLSRQLTGGTDLSGGQWQKLALARALFAVEAGAGVLVLDEPSANLDVRSEAELYDRFLEVTAGLTTIVISHRFSTVRRADRIAVLDGGHVTEIGTHDELLALGGTYASMFTLQAARYQDEVLAATEGDAQA